MPWYYFVAISVIAGALATVLRKITLTAKDNKRVGVYESAVALSFAVFVSLLVYTIITCRFIMPPFASIWWIVVLNLSLALIGWLTGQKALSLLGSGEYTVLVTARLVVTWVMSILLLDIGITSRQGTGIFLIMLAIFIVCYRRKEFLKANNVGVIFALLTALNYGVGTIFDQMVYRVSDPLSYAVIGFGVNTLLLIMLKPKSIKGLKLLADRRTGVTYAIAGILMAIANVMLFVGLKAADNATIVTGIGQTQVVLVAIFGALLIKAERKNFKRVLIGACITVVAACLILIK